MTFDLWTADDARPRIALPRASDDKYTRGVLGVITGSDRYPGAAMLGVEAALRTGVGMVRYLGGDRASAVVLGRRPEAVASVGRVQAWLVGSGMDAQDRDDDTAERLATAFAQGLPLVVDAGALDLVGTAVGPVLLTPHYSELARVLGGETAAIAADPAGSAIRAAEELGVTVLLKGASTFVADPHGTRIEVRSTNAWTATAGAGDALGGILGALVATHSRRIAGEPRLLSELAATGAYLHARAADLAGRGGPFTVLDLAVASSEAVRELVAVR